MRLNLKISLTQRSTLGGLCSGAQEEGRAQVTLGGLRSLRDSGAMMGRHREPSRAEQGPELDLGDDFR